MLFASLGKRYERLLVFTAPISLAAIAIFIVALASTRQQERVDAKCFAEASNAISANLAVLEKSWARAQPITTSEYWGIDYQHDLRVAWIDSWTTLPSNTCDAKVKQQLDDHSRQSPQSISSYFHKLASDLLSKPLEIYGVRLPKNTTIDLGGTKIEIELLSFTRILQILLLPVLLMWLGSMYSTRFRETMVIGRANSLVEIFPHLINQYVSLDAYVPRKRIRLAPYLPVAYCIFYAFMRIVLLAIFIVPPVAFYAASLYLMASQALSFPFGFAGLLVAMFCFSNLIVELFPQHVLKRFPNPEKQLL